MVQPLLLVGVAATAVLLLLSAFFSSSETAIFTVPSEWITAQSTESDNARTLAKLRDDPHRLLVTLLVGNNVVNVAISSIITVLVVQNLPPGPAVVATTVLTSVLVLVFGEIVPKSYGLGNAESWSLTVAPIVSVVERVLSPIITIFDWVTRGINERITGESDIERPYLE
jgi:Mg2+/Co2+ transporter CorB